jgi:hypothetical protein
VVWCGRGNGGGDEPPPPGTGERASEAGRAGT